MVPMSRAVQKDVLSLSNIRAAKMKWPQPLRAELNSLLLLLL